MKYLVAILFFCGALHAADSVSVVLEKATVTANVVIDATQVKATYAQKKTETGKTDEQLRGYRETLILDAIIEALRKARTAAEQTDAERQAELTAHKTKMDAEYAQRAALKPIIEVKP